MLQKKKIYFAFHFERMISGQPGRGHSNSDNTFKVQVDGPLTRCGNRLRSRDTQGRDSQARRGLDSVCVTDVGTQGRDGTHKWLPRALPLSLTQALRYRYLTLIQNI